MDFEPSLVICHVVKLVNKLIRSSPAMRDGEQLMGEHQNHINAYDEHVKLLLRACSESSC
jgi:hypothetical protein